ncbi:uncharacterized protein FOBCDRAFT_139942 [Fusarium oxysporum Fo47]|uniref:uncharacterized protein n=1 Tax=Fusarium oxysporum Fo47 TaxID=660027 RepID=UPI002869A6F1|nr:uncharacterized protein FOBCDRAFT_139942 [Fusarium oxysporum Fo47]WJG35776.1 hypothetical protein FOBCDRAFT_139942 [Fusarium oxysporum Fo47]
MASQQSHPSLSNSEYKLDGPPSQLGRYTEKQLQPRDCTTTDLGPPPDGGREAWLVVAGGFCANFASFGWINYALVLII